MAGKKNAFDDDDVDKLLDGDDVEISLEDDDDDAVEPRLSEDVDDITDDDLVVDEDEPEPQQRRERQPAAAAPVEEEAEEDFIDARDVKVLSTSVENLMLRENQATAAKSRAVADITASEKRMKDAIEAGDSDAQVKANSELQDAKTARDRADAALARIGSDKAELARNNKQLVDRLTAGERPIDPADRSTRAAAGRHAGSPLATQWVEKNAWFNDPQHSEDRELLLALDKKLAKEGKLKNSDPAYFDELGKRFNAVSPGKFKGLDGTLTATGQRQRGNGQGRSSVMPNTGVRSAADGGGKAKLDKADLREMRRFAMDPDNKAHRKQWLKTKRENAASERA